VVRKALRTAGAPYGVWAREPLERGAYWGKNSRERRFLC
jgi:hypothetical protein